MALMTSKRLLEPCKPWLTAPCPTMDLVATVSEKGTVDVWRFNGQRVFGLPTEDDAGRSVDGIAWKCDGRTLSVVLSTGLVILIDSFTGKITHRLSAPAQRTVGIPDWSDSGCPKRSSADYKHRAVNVDWSLHIPDFSLDKLLRSDLGSTGPLSNLVDLKTSAFGTRLVGLDLPHALTSVDIESSLPKLSTLPPTGADDDVFSTRTALDSIFHAGLSSTRAEQTCSDTVDVLLHEFSAGKMLVRIFDSFEIGSVGLAQALPKGLKYKQTIGHVSHTLLSDYYFAVEAVSDGPEVRNGRKRQENTSCQLLRVELRFLAQNSQHLPLLAAKATQLQNLLRYLQQIQTQLAAEVRTAFDLPRRFLSNVNESLAEQDSNANFKTAAYQLIVTGECDARLKEWLVDEVGERGLKRWEKAVADCLDMVRRMTSECLLPAVERCQVVLSRLEGLARFEDTASRLGLDEKDIRPARAVLDALTILCEDMLRDVCVEIREFGAFVRWLKWEAEVEALEEDSERAEEMREAFPGEADLRTVLDYIEGPMQESRVLAYVEADAKDATQADATTIPGDSQFYANFKSARREGKGTLPKLGALIQRLRNKTDVVFGHIAETLEKSILVSHVAELPKIGKELECRIIPAINDDQSFNLHILSSSCNAASSISHTVIPVDRNHQRQELSMQSQTMSIPGVVTLQDFKFVDDDGIVVLVATNDDRQILWHSVKSKAGHRDDSTTWEVKQTFMGGQMTGGMTPGALASTGRTGGRAIVVSDEAQMGFTVFNVSEEV